MTLFSFGKVGLGWAIGLFLIESGVAVMYSLLLLPIASLLLLPTAAKNCVNITVPVQIEARNGLFNVPTFQTNLDATTFAQQFTTTGQNFTNSSLQGYTTVTGEYNISAKFCKPDKAMGQKPTVQLLTHGLGFDKTYWDLPYNDFNYSYIDVAVDRYGFCTLSIDRLGVGNSSIADPLNVLQAPAEVSAIYKLTMMLRNGTLPQVPHAFDKIVHVGHSFGSLLSYELAVMYPAASNALILTGFSLNGSFLPETLANWNSKLARLNQPLRFGNISSSAVRALEQSLNASLFGLSLYFPELISVVQSTDILDFTSGLQPGSFPQAANLPTGYLTWVDPAANQFTFLYPPFFDPDIAVYAELHKFPYTVGEILTIGSVPKAAAAFTGPVQVVTGVQDAIYCGSDCTSPSVNFPSISKAFPASRKFEAYLQPNTGHAINVHYNSTAAYCVIQEFLMREGLGSK
ncbi:MAG: hypothetical protein Q9187_008058 [Circinaria calcarea]